MARFARNPGPFESAQGKLRPGLHFRGVFKSRCHPERSEGPMHSAGSTGAASDSIDPSAQRARLRMTSAGGTHHRATFSISSFNSAYGTAPGWYHATFPALSNSTSVGVVDAP